MRWLWVAALITACSSSTKAKPDAPPTSLVGTIACGSATCVDQQLCVHAALDGSAIDTRCVDVASGCLVYDCSAYFRDCTGCNSCSACLVGICEMYDGATQMLVTMSVSARDVGCGLTSSF